MVYYYVGGEFMRKFILSILFVLSFTFVGCSANQTANASKKDNVSESEVAENYLTVKMAIGNYIAKTSFEDNKTGNVSEKEYDDGIKSLESLNFIIKCDKILSEEMKKELIEINNELINYCAARVKNDVTNEGYYKSIGLENEFRKKYNSSQSKPNEPKPSEVIVQEKLTLEESKEELANIKDSITNGEGKVKYISGGIESGLIPITIKMKDGNGEIKDTTIDVYEMKFVTRSNTFHRVYLNIENIGSKHTYQKGDSIYYNLKDSLNQAWYIGENEEVLYLVLLEDK